MHVSPADRGYLVVPAELRACAAAARVAAVAGPHCPSLAAVVRGPAPGGLRTKDVAQAIGIPLAGSLRRWGQASPVVACERASRLEIVDGFKRWSAAPAWVSAVASGCGARRARPRDPMRSHSDNRHE